MGVIWTRWERCLYRVLARLHRLGLTVADPDKAVWTMRNVRRPKERWR